MTNQQLKVTIGGASSPGAKPINQDAFAAHVAEGHSLTYKGVAAAVADGVSYCSDSHIASQTSVTSFINDYYGTPDCWSVSHAVPRVIKGLNSWLQQHNANAHREKDTLLCTFSSVVIKSNSVHCFHVGDSRIYHYSQGKLTQLTRDHQRQENGRHYLTRALGGELHLQVDYSHHALETGDQLLLTTDGIHDTLTEQQLVDLLTQSDESLEQKADQMIELAVANGSDDNLTALILQIDQLPHLNLTERYQQITTLPIPPVLEPGNRIDGYTVTETLFSGSRSHLYLVEDQEGHQFALKAPSINFSDDLSYLESFVREEWVGQQMNHPNVMKTIEPNKPKRFLYHICEHINGQSLRQWMDDHPEPSIEQVRQIILQIILGLRAFQRADMIHQDLKPENILIDSQQKIKIIDFGTVLAMSVDEIGLPQPTDTPVGATGYCAPEYLVGETATMRSDQFSLAVICYEMLTGQLPYKPLRQSQSKINHYSDMAYTPATLYRRDLPLWIEGCLRKALQPNPEDRYPAFSEFAKDLTKPNKQLLAKLSKQPLLEKNPLLFWQLSSGLLLVINIVLLLQVI